jgi:proton-coupled amino acid transporter
VLIRDLAKLSSTALVADASILVGLVYIFGSKISIVAMQGIADVHLFNPRHFSLLVGVAVFSFEGVGMVIPITDAMREPHNFPKVLTGVMLGVLGASSLSSRLLFLTRGSALGRRGRACVCHLRLRDPDRRPRQPQRGEQDGAVSESLFSSSVSVKPLTCGAQVQFIVSLAIMLSVPLRLFPAIRIIENAPYSPHPGKRRHSPKYKC